MTLAYLTLAVVVVISVRASISLHRYLGLCAIVAGAAGVNYFMMDPVYSFRLSRIGDIVALGIYGVAGIFLTLEQTSSVARHVGVLAFRRPEPLRGSLSHDPATLLDAYHFSLLVQLCAQISAMTGTYVDPRDVLNLALLHLGKTFDSEGSREILEDIRLQWEYEKWVDSNGSGEAK